MVYFNCDACGESLKKNQVEKHRYKCRNCRVLSCVDCGHDFRGNEYEAHIKCISEEEKYSGKNYKPKPNANKGEIKQELWTQQVQRAIDKTADPKLQNVLQQLRNYSNIPRKKAKFENFLFNSLHLRNAALVGKVWEAISAELDAKQESESSVAVPQTESNGSLSEPNGHPLNVATEDLSECTADIKQKLKKHKKHKPRPDDEAKSYSKDVVQPYDNIAICDSKTKSETKKKKKKKHQEDVVSMEVCENDDKSAVTAEDSVHKHKKSAKKRKRSGDLQDAHESGDVQNANDDKRTKTADDEPSADVVAVTEVVHYGKFKWHPVIINVLQQAPDNQLPVKKLRKKVLGEFNARGGDGRVYTKEKLLAKFTRKVNKCAQLKVHKDVVSLVD